MTFVEHFTQFGAPRRFSSGWTVRIDTHSLGGLRHWYRRWEIADIGLLVHYRRGGKLLQSKAAVLQSKRLYPEGLSVAEDTQEDYETGFARLADPEDHRVPLYVESRYRFDEQCRYGALRAHDEQCRAIDQYLKTSKIPVYYQLYNPAVLPYEQVVPLTGDESIDSFDLATRIVPARDVLDSLAGRPENYTPRLTDLAGEGGALNYGWRLEYFVADLLLRCKEGYIFKTLQDENVFNLFNRRGGAISAAVALSLEQTDA